MNRRGLCRPSLKITLSGDQTEASQPCVQVWNPFLHAYQPINSVEEGIARVAELANIIGHMWAERHPKRDALEDVPNVAETDGSCWAELRINATTFRSYDTRSYDRPTWAKATSLKHATTIISSKVGYMLLDTAAP